MEILEKGQSLRSNLEKSPGQTDAQTLLLQEEIEALMEELQELGCFYKDWDFSMGLVDFPAFIEGEAVFLCWRSDEPSVQWYHSMEGGYLARKPIPEHLLTEAG